MRVEEGKPEGGRKIVIFRSRFIIFNLRCRKKNLKKRISLKKKMDKKKKSSWISKKGFFLDT